MKPEEGKPDYAVDIRKFKPEVQELIEEVRKALQGLTREELIRLTELSEAGAVPSDFTNKEQIAEFIKKVKGETK